MNLQLESLEHYEKALKQGRRAHRESVHQGKYPYLQALDDILEDTMVAGQVDLGILDIPMEKIVGTKTSGRTNSFSADFMPLLEETSEFAMKWCKLCVAHLGDEGIRDPIFCYEYLGRFYVQEGNKRVSVLKYFGASSIPGYVIRILPNYIPTIEIQCYYEFVRYYPQTKLYQLIFTQLGSFQKLQAALGYEADHVWTDNERRHFSSAIFHFQTVFKKLGGEKLNITSADALLVWLRVYSFEDIRKMSMPELSKSLQAVWADIKALGSAETITVNTGSADDGKFRNKRFFSMLPSYLNVAFVHELNPENSNWVKAHEQGRKHLKAVLGEQVITQAFFGVGVGEQAEEAMETAIKNGAEVIFATTAPLIAACRKIAVRHPNVKILNCSISMPYTGVRTYYSRIYEGKFISGAIAGAISKSDRIGYIASYPIFGVPAGINAFALGAQLTNPRARIELKWACVQGDPVSELKELGVDTISTLDIPMPGWDEGNWGTFQISPDGKTVLLASPYWDWGTFYVKLARSILSGDWDALNTDKHGAQAVNYWWGMASGVIGLEMTKALPAGVEVLAQILKRDMIHGTIAPFHRHIVSQDGMERNDGNKYFPPDKLLQMDWLCENVDGCIPKYEELSEKAQKIVRLQGIYRDTIPPEKEGVLL